MLNLPVPLSPPGWERVSGPLGAFRSTFFLLYERGPDVGPVGRR